MEPYLGNNHASSQLINSEVEWALSSGTPIPNVVNPASRPFQVPTTPLAIRPDSHNTASNNPPQPDIEPQTSRRISRQEWESHRKVIQSHYYSKTLKELRILMAATAGESQWKKKLTHWGLNGKNVKPRVTKFIKKRAYRRQIESNKLTQFTIKGELVPMDKVGRYLKDAPVEPTSPTGSTPSGLTYKTLSPRLTTTTLNAGESVRDGSEICEQPANPLTQNVESLGTIKMAFWDGHPIDYFLSEFTTAKLQAQHDEYASAKEKFTKAIEGCKALLGPIHAQTIMVCGVLVKEALRNSDVATAIDIVHQSHNAHRNLLGIDHKKTWVSLASMGKVYFEAGKIHDAYHMLSNARDGIRRHAASASSEDQYLCTKNITMDIVKILQAQEDYEAITTEYMQLITQAESLGDLYLPDVTVIKHDLVHIFYTQEWECVVEASEKTHLPLIRLEELMQSIVKINKFPKRHTHKRACALEHLRSFYHQTRQNAKLVEFLENVEKELSTTNLPEDTGMRRLKRGLAESFSWLGFSDKAEWWLLHLKEEIEDNSDALSRDSLTILVELAEMHLTHGHQDQAREYFQKSQQLAKEILPKDHAFHKRIQRSISHGKSLSGCCPDCHITPDASSETLSMGDNGEKSNHEDTSDEGSEYEDCSHGGLDHDDND
ncbi:hypothetical protein NPX13_g10562 [Xylaria arbuscula]|uniref:Clr5 domain-containing protein n=1 Tax=Xylaria arbuscula TaxID=114810 RepID=A0A9W8THV9_9PEZI|nr:hypothetical protein NPX13_g10562 [Xylaria arbuscula]